MGARVERNPVARPARELDCPSAMSLVILHTIILSPPAGRSSQHRGRAEWREERLRARGRRVLAGLSRAATMWPQRCRRARCSRLHPRTKQLPRPACSFGTDDLACTYDAGEDRGRAAGRAAAQTRWFLSLGSYRIARAALSTYVGGDATARVGAGHIVYCNQKFAYMVGC